MIRLSFITPLALLLLTLLPVFWAFTAFVPRRVALWRAITNVVLRSVMLASLVLALAGTQLVQPVRDVTTVFLIDASDSVAPVQRQRAFAYVEDALRNSSATTLAGVVVFGDNALVERAPGSLTTLGRIASVPVATRTNLQEALQLGMALLPADSQQRLVLLSDGGENSGRVGDAAQLAQVRGVPIDVLVLGSERGPDVLVSRMDVPSVAREGQDIAFGVTIQSALNTNGRLQLFVDGVLALEEQVQIPQGQSTVPLRVPAGVSGFRRLEARLEADGDNQAQNNRAAAFTDVQGPPRVLMLASDQTRATNLRDAFTASGARVDLLNPLQAPADLAQLGDYAAVVLVDTPASDVPRPLLQALQQYVRDLGRGFAMVGGEDSFGAGGYRRTVMEDILPVNLDPLDTSQRPDLALAMVIDRSGSMSDSSGNGTRTKLDLAKEAVYQASLGLGQSDQIGLIFFDTEADWVLPMQQLPSGVEIEQALSSLGPGGGTDIRPGIEQAADGLAQSNARIKHVILLTDGIADSNYSDLIDKMRGNDVTISTVAVGDDANPNLQAIATRGGGRFYQVRQVEDVPRIFLQETVIVAGRDIVEGAFTPQIGVPSAATRGLTSVPSLYGYNGTEIKQVARSLLQTPDGKPVLAQWQYGLGRSVVWTSDFKGQWGRDWVQWSEFPRFANALLDLLLPAQVSNQLNLQVTENGAQAVLDLSAQDADGAPLNDLSLVGRLLDPKNTPQPLTFTQVAPGRYRATSTTSDTGVYLAQVAASSADGVAVGEASAGLAVSYSPEYGQQQAKPQLLRDLAAATGGRVDAPASEAFLPTAQQVGRVREISLPLIWLALVLLPFDIALRRLFLRRSDLRLPGRSVPVPAAASPSLARLDAAKQRARRPAPAQRPAAPVSQAEAAPAPPAAAPQQAAPPAPPAEPPPARSEEEQFARLLAAKRRARSRRSE